MTDWCCLYILDWQWESAWICNLGVNEYWYRNYSWNTKLVTLYSNSIFSTCLAGFEILVNLFNWENGRMFLFLKVQGCNDSENRTNTLKATLWKLHFFLVFLLCVLLTWYPMLALYKAENFFNVKSSFSSNLYKSEWGGFHVLAFVTVWYQIRDTNQVGKEKDVGP